MIDKEKIINFDLQGWPICKMNIRNIIESLGGKLVNGNWIIPESEALDVYPELFEDDGMGYGTNQEYVTSINFDLEKKICTIFRDRKLDDIEIWKNAKFFPSAVVIKKGEKDPELEMWVNEVKEENGKYMYNCEYIHFGTSKWFDEDELEFS